MNLKEIVGLANAIRLRADTRPGWLRRLQEVRTQDGLYYRFLFELTRAVRPARILEIGTRAGFSAAQMSAGHPDARLITVDIDPRSKARFGKVPELRALANVVPLTGDSRKVRSDVEQHFSEIDLVFLDSDHRYETGKSELALYYPMLRHGGGILLLDDIALSSEMKRLWNEIPGPKADLSFLHLTSGAGFGVHVK